MVCLGQNHQLRANIQWNSHGKREEVLGLMTCVHGSAGENGERRVHCHRQEQCWSIIVMATLLMVTGLSE